MLECCQAQAPAELSYISTSAPPPTHRLRNHFPPGKSSRLHCRPQLSFEGYMEVAKIVWVAGGS